MVVVLVGMVFLVGGHDILALCFMSSVAGVGALRRASCGTWGLMVLLVSCMIPCTLLPLLYMGSLGISAWSPDSLSVSLWGSFSLLLGLYLNPLSSSPSSPCTGTHLSCTAWHHCILASSFHPISSLSLSPSFMSPNMVCTSSSCFLPFPLALPFVSPSVTAFMLIITSLVVTMAILGFVSLAGGLVVVWVWLGMIGLGLGIMGA